MKALLALMFAAAMLHAQTGEDPQIETKSSSDLLVIKTQKGFSTLIEFPSDQKIREVTCGDKDSWVIEGSGRFLHVKPGKEGIVTNINVLMDDDQTIYSFVLREVTGPRGVKGKADLEVTVNPDQTIPDLTNALERANKTNEGLLKTLAQAQQALSDVTAKYRALTANANPAATTAQPSRPAENTSKQVQGSRHFMERK